MDSEAADYAELTKKSRPRGKDREGRWETGKVKKDVLGKALQKFKLAFSHS